MHWASAAQILAAAAFAGHHSPAPITLPRALQASSMTQVSQAIRDRKQRLEKVFELCDVNADGVLEESDFEVPTPRQGNEGWPRAGVWERASERASSG